MVGVGSSCGACKFLRRKCEDICIFAPYFSYDGGVVHFAAVHKVFGASNVSKLLSHLPIYNRDAAAATIAFEATARIRDPVRGCVSQILTLQQQVAKLQEEIDSLTMPIDPPRSNMEIGHKIIPQSVTHMVKSGRADEFEANPPQLHPADREAIERLEDCLFSDEQSSLEELSMYVSDLEKYLLH